MQVSMWTLRDGEGRAMRDFIWNYLYGFRFMDYFCNQLL